MTGREGMYLALSAAVCILSACHSQDTGESASEVIVYTEAEGLASKATQLTEQWDVTADAETTEDDRTSEQASVGETSEEGTSEEGTSEEETSVEEASAGETSVEETSAGETLTETSCFETAEAVKAQTETFVPEETFEEKTMSEPLSAEPITEEPVTEEHVTEESASEETTTRETTVQSPEVISLNGIEIAKHAMDYMGRVPYVLGGDSLETGTDCSGFTVLIYRLSGITGLPRTAASQSVYGAEISLAELRPGDLVAESYTGDPLYTGHAGIYIGGGLMISNWPGSGVEITEVRAPGHSYRARRIFDNTFSGSDDDAYMQVLSYSFEIGLTGYCSGGVIRDGVPYIMGVYPLSNPGTEYYMGEFDLNAVPAGYEKLVEAWKQYYLENDGGYTIVDNGATLMVTEDGREFYDMDYFGGRIELTKEEWLWASRYGTYRHGRFW